MSIFLLTCFKGQAQVYFENFEGVLPPQVNNFLENGFAINRMPGWVNSTGTPSICGPANANTTPVPSVWACLGTAVDPGQQCWEGIVGQLPAPLVVGTQYTLSFDANAFDIIGQNAATNLRISIGSNIQGGASNTICQPDPAIPFDQMINNALPIAAGWNNYTMNFVATTPSDQLHFLIGNATFNLGIDNICLYPSNWVVLDPVITYSGLGQFTYSINGETIPNGVNSIVINWGDGLPAAVVNAPFPNPLNVTHPYTNSGNYTVCVSFNNSTCLTACKVIEYDPCKCYGNKANVLEQGIHNWTNTTQLIEFDVLLMPGAHLKVDNTTVNINEGCRFIVTRGASMEVDNNSLLTTNCDGRQWSGISVWGNRVISHQNVSSQGKIANPQLLTPSDPGVLKISGESTIEHMNRGSIQAQGLWGYSQFVAKKLQTSGLNFAQPNTTGGIVQANNANFRDNRLCAEFHDYPYTNFSSFKNCDFFTDNDNSSVGNEGVNIWETDGIEFLDCRFDNIPSRGITALDGGITVTKSVFNSINQGIALGSIIAPSAYTYIGNGHLDDQNYFKNDNFGIWSDGISLLEVNVNQFENHRTAGIHLSNLFAPSRFEIEHNNFSTNQAGQVMGISLEAVGNYTFEQEVNCNQHVGDVYGLMVRGNCRGLTFDRNDYSTLGEDISIRKWINKPGEVYPNQGTNGYPRSNLFGSGINNEMITQQNGTVTFTYIHATSLDPFVNERLSPDCPINGSCAVKYNFYAIPSPSLFNSQNCQTEEPPKFSEPCETKDCLMEHFLEYAELSQTILPDHTDWVKVVDAEAILNRDINHMFAIWATSSNWEEIEEISNLTNRQEDKAAHLHLLVHARQLTLAQSLIDEWKGSENQDLVLMAELQQMYLDLLNSNETRFYPNETQIALLRGLAYEFGPFGAYARSLLHLLTGEIVIPEFEESLTHLGEERAAKSPVTEPLGVYPNPAQNALQIISDNLRYTRYTLYDWAGTPKLAGRLEGKTSTIQLPEWLPTGNYVLKCYDTIRAESKTTSVMIIK